MSTDAWKKENTIQKNIKLLRNSNLAIALKKASKVYGVAESTYIRTALEEKLTRDGYLEAEE